MREEKYIHGMCENLKRLLGKIGTDHRTCRVIQEEKSVFWQVMTVSVTVRREFI
jgi:hypothetical protein